MTLKNQQIERVNMSPLKNLPNTQLVATMNKTAAYQQSMRKINQIARENMRAAVHLKEGNQ
jgi:hypothetical protein